MIKHSFLYLAVWGFATSGLPAIAQQIASDNGIRTSLVVTLEPKHGREAPALEMQDLTVEQGRDKRPVTEILPFINERAGMQLALLLDDSAAESFNTQISDLKKFVTNLPSSTQIAIGYMRNGTVQLLQQFTADHQAAANSIRLSMGSPGVNPSPYIALSDLIKRWPESPVRREVIMVSDGIDRLGGSYPDNPYVNTAISDAQRAGILVYTIYTPGVGHFGHTFWRMNWGQNFLSQISDETGAESYFNGFGDPVSFTPYLEDILKNQQHQFLLTFLAKPEKKADLQSFRIRADTKDVEVVAAHRVWVKAGL